MPPEIPSKVRRRRTSRLGGASDQAVSHSCARDLERANDIRWPAAARMDRRKRETRVRSVGNDLVGGEAVEQAVAAGARRSAWLQPPSGPREGCDEFQDFEGSSSRRPWRSWWPTIAAPAPLFVQLPQVRSSPAGERRAVRLRAGEDVVPVRRVAAAVDHLALLGQRGLLADLVVGAVQIVDVLRDHLALGVLPRAVADAVAGVDGCPGALRAQIGAPGLAAGAAACASCWQCRSAPSRPPRSAPLPADAVCSRCPYTKSFGGIPTAMRLLVLFSRAGWSVLPPRCSSP